MTFSYSKKIENLRELYRSMCGLGVEIGTFVHVYNGVESDVIFDTRTWVLSFIKKGLGDTLTLSIQKGFRFTIEGDSEYRSFIAYFGISGGKGKFSIADFVDNFSNQVPTQYIITDNTRQTIISYDRLDSGSDGIYPIGIKNWDVIHAKNPNLPRDKYHRTKENLLKTKELYPNIYDIIKDKDITVLYGKKLGTETTCIINGNFL
ncbi:DUF6037 family protein [Streptococcus suis]|uniref:DUF6037 family protein n=1 Tax=Streptococcus suis TaxID=1307 RepID=UPI000409C1B6|nr:DUF6037 family protein [Streptococcus suis]MBO3756288.1 hypothetical protein [Streptococcus suis]MBO4131914.1 hypothetical protein [Streptococcus suis]MBO4133086.1 hypothetical protein [Streptococcus suis]NQK13056.1 hypothetical protein [Streptococcus suis]HEM3555346.1 hypothetical protein [Streptococcus suis]